MPPFFFTKQIPDEGVTQHMKDNLQRTGKKKKTGDGKKLVGALSAHELLLYAPLVVYEMRVPAQRRFSVD